MFKNQIVLYSQNGCKYCNYAKQALSNFETIAIIIDENWYITPCLVAYDSEGNIIEQLEGFTTNGRYLQFLRQHKELL